MKKTALVLATAATLGLSAVTAPSPAEARGGWGWGGALAGGLIAGAVIGGLASNAYGYGPGYGYYGGYPGYYGGYAPELRRRLCSRLLWRLWRRIQHGLLRWLCPGVLRRLWIPSGCSPGVRLLRRSQVLSSVAPPLSALVNFPSSGQIVPGCQQRGNALLNFLVQLLFLSKSSHIGARPFRRRNQNASTSKSMCVARNRMNELFSRVLRFAIRGVAVDPLPQNSGRLEHHHSTRGNRHPGGLRITADARAFFEIFLQGPVSLLSRIPDPL